MNASWLQPTSGGVRLHLHIQPRASRTGIAGVMGDRLKIRVAAPPVDDAANEALVRFLAKKLGCARGDIRLVAGRTGRQKVVEIRGLTPEEAGSRLAPGSAG